MSLRLFNKNKIILDIRSGTFCTLYEKILQIIEEKELNLNESLEWLIDKLYGATGGVSLDFANYLKTKEDAIFFALLVKKGMEKFEKEYPNLSKDARESLWSFHNELVKYAQELPE